MFSIRHRLFLFLFPWILTDSLSAQAIITGMTFSPPTFYVGDRVELAIGLALNNNLTLEVPEIYPSTEWIDIRKISVEITDTTTIIHINFTPFAAGTRILPPLDFGAIYMDEIPITTQTLLHSSRPETRQLRGQLMIPGTRLALAILLALVTISPFLFMALGKLLLTEYRRIRDMVRHHWPLHRLRRLIKRLKNDLQTNSPSLWYSQLTEGLRIYLGSRLHHDCQTATTTEIAALKVFSVPNTPQHKLLKLLQEADMVKFAGKHADENTLRRALYIVEIESLNLEKMNDNIQ